MNKKHVISTFIKLRFEIQLYVQSNTISKKYLINQFIYFYLGRKKTEITTIANNL
jgi:hypothetical protein